MFTKTLRLCTNCSKRQIIQDIIRQTASVTNNDINTSLQLKNNIRGYGNKNILAIKKFNRYVFIQLTLVYRYT